MASDFYRLRLLRLDEEDTLDLEWREDILYREPPRQSVDEYVCWVVEAVDLSDEDVVARLRMFEDSDQAHEFLQIASEDLVGLTRAEFETKHFPASAGEAAPDQQQ
jgi:hypothetical protein